MRGSAIAINAQNAERIARSSQHCICGHERRVHMENCAMCHACRCVSFARTEHLGGEWSPAQHGRAL